MEEVVILGQSITLAQPAEIMPLLNTKLQQAVSYRLATVNPEFLVESRRNGAFRQSLEQADLRLADGAGIILAAWLTGHRASLKQRCTGVDLTAELLTLAHQQQLSVLVVHEPKGLTLAADLQRWLSHHYLGLAVTIITATENLTAHHDSRIVLVALGAPAQELWLSQHQDDFPRALTIGVGGTFDMLSGTIQRAPASIRRFGFEWLWRLLSQPERRRNRLKRILRATVVFPWLVITTSSKFKDRNSKQ